MVEELQQVAPVQPGRPPPPVRFGVGDDGVVPVVDDDEGAPHGGGRTALIENHRERIGRVHLDRSLFQRGQRLSAQRGVHAGGHAGAVAPRPALPEAGLQYSEGDGLGAPQPQAAVRFGEVGEQRVDGVGPHRARQLVGVADPPVQLPGREPRVALVRAVRLDAVARLVAARLPLVQVLPREGEDDAAVRPELGALRRVVGEPVDLRRRVVVVPVEVHRDLLRLVVDEPEHHVRPRPPDRVLQRDPPPPDGRAARLRVRDLDAQVGGLAAADDRAARQRGVAAVPLRPVLQPFQEPRFEFALDLVPQGDLARVGDGGGLPAVQQLVQHVDGLGPADLVEQRPRDVRQQAPVAGALGRVLPARAFGGAGAGRLQHPPELRRVGEAVQVAGAAGQRVVQDEEAAPPPGGLVRHRRRDDLQVVGVAAVAGGDARHQRRLERRRPLLHVQRRHGEQDAQRLRAEFVREDHLVVVGVPRRAPVRAPGAVVAPAAVRGGRADQRVAAVPVVLARRPVHGRAAAGRAHVEVRDLPLLPREPGRVAPVGAPHAEVEAAHDGVPGEVDAEHGVGVPPRAGRDVGAVDVDGDGVLVEAALPLVGVVADPGLVAPVVGEHPRRLQHLVQVLHGADGGVAAPGARRDIVRRVEARADVPAARADPPVLP